MEVLIDVLDFSPGPAPAVSELSGDRGPARGAQSPTADQKEWSTMKLASLYGRDVDASVLHVAVGDGYVPVDELARSSGHDRLRGLADVGELLALGPEALDELRSLDPGSVPAVPAADAVLAPPSGTRARSSASV